MAKQRHDYVTAWLWEVTKVALFFGALVWISAGVAYLSQDKPAPSYQTPRPAAIYGATVQPAHLTNKEIAHVTFHF